MMVQWILFRVPLLVTTVEMVAVEQRVVHHQQPQPQKRQVTSKRMTVLDRLRVRIGRVCSMGSNSLDLMDVLLTECQINLNSSHLNSNNLISNPHSSSLDNSSSNNNNISSNSNGECLLLSNSHSHGECHRSSSSSSSSRNNKEVCRLNKRLLSKRLLLPRKKVQKSLSNQIVSKDHLLRNISHRSLRCSYLRDSSSSNLQLLNQTSSSLPAHNGNNLLPSSNNNLAGNTVNNPLLNNLNPVVHPNIINHLVLATVCLHPKEEGHHNSNNLEGILDRVGHITNNTLSRDGILRVILANHPTETSISSNNNNPKVPVQVN